MFSSPRDLVVVVDAYEFKNAPDNTLMWMIGHELGHIVMMHSSGQTPQGSQQQELDADRYINQLMKNLGVNRAEAFRWMGQRRDQIQKLEKNQRFERDPSNQGIMQNHSHPTMDQRIRQARDQGFELSQSNTDQLDQALKQA
jgi:Zn-dependent protease with chaperone function